MTRLLLVHIAKTGGTSLRRLFRQVPATASFDCVHNDTFIRFRDGERVKRGVLQRRRLPHYDIAVLMVRHPLARLRSCHSYFLQGGLNQRGKGFFPADAEAQQFLQNVAPTLSACCHHLPDVAARIPHFQPACRWLDALPNPLADLVFTGRQEHFNQDLQRLFALLGLDTAQLQPEHLNASRSQDEQPLDPLALRLAEQFYNDDFQRFGYDPTPLSPPQLIQYWDQPDPPPELVERMDQWRSRHPDWCYRRYDRTSAAAFIAEHYGPELRDAFLDIRLPAMQADVFRIAALQVQAGVWIDAATRCLQPLDHWLNRRQPLLLLRRAHQQHPKIWNGLIHAADPHHPLLQQAWQRIAAVLLARGGKKVYRDFGPGVLRQLLATGDGALQAGLEVVPETDLKDQLVIGSSSEILGSDQHWSQRQGRESLYLSGG